VTRVAVEVAVFRAGCDAVEMVEVVFEAEAAVVIAAVEAVAPVAPGFGVVRTAKIFPWLVRM